MELNFDTKYLVFAQNVLDETNIKEFRLSSSKHLNALADNDYCIVLDPDKLFASFIHLLCNIAQTGDNKKLARKFKIFLDFFMYPECKSSQSQVLITLYHTLKQGLTPEDFQVTNKLQQALVNKATKFVKSYIMKSDASINPKYFALLYQTDAVLAKLKLDTLAAQRNYSNVLPLLDLTTNEGFEIACHLISNFHIKDHDAIANILPQIAKIGDNNENLSLTANSTRILGLGHMVDMIINDDIAITTNYYVSKISPLTGNCPYLNIETALALYAHAYLIDGNKQVFTTLLLKDIGYSLLQIDNPSYALKVAQRIDYQYSPSTDEAIYNLYNNLLQQKYTTKRDIISIVEIIGFNYCANLNATHRSELLTRIYELYPELGDTYEFTNLKTRLNLQAHELSNADLWTPEAIVFWSDSKNSLLWEDAIVNLSKMVNPASSDKLNIKQAIKMICLNHKTEDISFLTQDLTDLIKMINKSV